MSEQTNSLRNVRQLASMLHELDDMLVSCMRCGICQSVCPIYGATMREADVARGKIALLENLANSMIADAEGVNAKLNRCLLCGSCQKNCPSGVNSLDIFLRARGIVTGYMGLSPVKKIIFRGLLVRPGLFNIFLEISGKFQGLFLKDANTTLGTSCSSLLRPVVGDRHFPALAKEPFHAQLSSLDTPAGASGLRIAFFPGCVSDKLFPNVPAAMLTVMQKHEVGVYMPPDQGCCGIPALASGDRKTYDALVRRNVELFCAGSFDYLITPCATCAATIKEIWPKLLEGHSEKIREKIGLLQKKTIDVSAFLVDVLKVPLPASSREGKRITYHDACHLKKSLGVSEQPRVLLNGLPGWQLVEMPEADRCCGCGGSFSLFHYDLSSQIGQRKRDNIVSVRPDAVATGCPACMMQIMDMLSHNNDHIPVKHVIELYAETL